MREEQKGAVKNSIGRIFITALLVLIQVVWIIELFVRLNKYSTGISLVSGAIALIVVIKIYGRDMNSAMKMPWMILIMAFPVAGVGIYLLCGHSGVNIGIRKHFQGLQSELTLLLPEKEDVLQKLSAEDRQTGNMARYISHSAGYPVYGNTDLEFYPEAVDGFEAQKEALKQAKKFIFMEYHAIEDAQSFAGMKSILFEKAKEGVEVRLIYDDVGSMGFINTDFVKQMESHGIQCRIFNKIVPFVNIFMNNRDHRKITVIDGQVGFTGGYNLADEYFNITHPYGLWKDSGVRMEGDAVQSLTVMFLEMWNAIKKTDTDYAPYFPEIAYTAKQTGYVQPYADNPLDDEHTGENVYMNILNSAQEYAYFITPYLLISDEMNKAFTLAARRGVDVRIITPGIPDKKFVYKATRSYYNRLVKKGVRIFEYTPGFCHAKQCVSDDKAAVVGTINLDYRSLYHHFENAAAFYHKDAVAGVKADFDHLFEECHEVTEQYRSHRSTALRVGQCILRLFAPLL